MFTEKELIGARIILKNVNQGRKYIKTDELTAEMKKEGEDEFSGGSSEVKKALSIFEAGNLIVRINENTYRIVADIAAIREFILRESYQKPEEEVATYDLDLEELTGSDWRLTDENQADHREEDEETEDDGWARIVARRQELIRRLQSKEDEKSDEEEEKHISPEEMQRLIEEDGTEEICKKDPAKELMKVGDKITETLAGYRIESEVMAVAVGPSVIQYNLKIHSGTNSVLRHVPNVEKDLLCQGSIRAYINREEDVISFEVPKNEDKRKAVRFSDILSADRFDHESEINFVIGKGMYYDVVMGGLLRMENALIYGEAGSGKSNLLHSIICSLISKYSPRSVRLLLCSGKRGELSVYRGTPHLATKDVIEESEEFIKVLNWVATEVRRRYDLIEAAGQQELEAYNAVQEKSKNRLPRIILIADDLSDLASDLHDACIFLHWIQQNGIPVGVHMILATRSVRGMYECDIKGFRTRIVFKTANKTGARSILGCYGAEKLLGKGDMLLLCKTDSKLPQRVQAAEVTEEDIRKSVKEAQGEKDETASDALPRDPMYIRALGYVVEAGVATNALLERRCQIGFFYAYRILLWMESQGFISEASDPHESRRVLLTKEEFTKRFGDIE